MATTRIRELEGVQNRKDHYFVDPRQIIVTDGWNPRTDFSGHKELVESIKANGVLVPLRVRRGGENDEQIFLLDGERRLRASLEAEAEAVPCIFERTTMNDVEAMVLSLVTNQGKPLEPIEEAVAFGKLRGWGLNNAEIARRVGKSEGHVRNRLLLLDASPAVQQAVAAKQVKPSDATRIVRQAEGNIDAQNTKLRQTLGSPQPKRRTPFMIVTDMLPKLSPEELAIVATRAQGMIAPIRSAINA